MTQDKTIRALTPSALKKSCDKAVTQIKVSFSVCPKCGLRTFGTVGSYSVCANCDHTEGEVMRLE